ncbi:17-beta-hydroxysteroid dehydrogenase 13-like isoform X1 [Armigeres subalbatus]|uniref:17-beta-hydroxysteroid dehydrogenase 13-like isoform X1 n=1 Tax=Armigeres subalbatus TaxID=124917 RepID=UPI002ECFC2D4
MTNSVKPRSPVLKKVWSLVALVVEVVLLVVDIIKVTAMGQPILFQSFFRLVWPKQPKNVTGQLVMITGGAGGLGRELALRFANQGCNIVIVDVNLKSAEQTCQEVRRKNVSAYAYKVDVSSYDDVQKLMDTIYREVAPIDILINNAGLIHFKFLQNSTVEDINQSIDVNVKGYIWTTKILLEKMKERKRGHIVAISSLSGVHAFPWAVVYSATKFAVNGFMQAITEQLRLEGYADQIHTTCVCPYYIATRKDIVDFLQKPRFKLLSTQYTARNAVEAILRNESFVSVPPMFDLGIKIMYLFPLRIQQLVRDYVMKECELHSLL